VTRLDTADALHAEAQGSVRPNAASAGNAVSPLLPHPHSPETIMPGAAPQTSVVNGLWNAFSSGVVALVGLLSSVVVVRSLSPHEYGVLSYYLWLAGLSVSLGTLAFSPSLTKIGAELLGAGQPGLAAALSRWVQRTLGWLNLGVAALLAGAALLWPQNARFLLIIAALQLPTALASALSSRFWSQQNFRVVSLWNVLAAVTQMILIVLALRLRLGTPGLAFAVLSAGLVSWLGLSWASRRLSRAAAPHLPGATLRHYLAFLLPASLAILFETVVWQRSELFFINRLGDAVQLGQYSLAYTIFAIFLSIGWALITSYLPSMASDHGASRPGGVAQKLQQGATLAVLYAAPISGGAIVTLPWVIRLLYGDKMLGAVPVGQMLLLSLVPSVLAGLFSLTINATGGIWRNVAVGLGVAGVNIGLDMVLIPRLGAFGGAVATVVAQSLYLLGLLLLARRGLGFGQPGLNIDWRAPLLILGLGAATTLLLPALILRLLPGLAGVALSVALGGGLYVLLVWKFGFLAVLRQEQTGSVRA
jgi:O-antigen/teichoic acid export membrane protein